MGNETSVPEDDGLQPPSQIPPGGGEQPRVGGKALKVAKAVLQKATDNSFQRGDSEQSAATAGDKFYPATQSSELFPSPASKMSFKPGDGNPTIPVMFASEGSGRATSSAHHAASHASSTGTAAAHATVSSIRTGGKAVRNGGRALLNSMKNLTVNTTGSSSTPKPPTLRAENDWETRWDDDDDSDEGDDDEEEAQPKAAAATSPVRAQAPDLLSAPSPTLALPSLQQSHSSLEWERDQVQLKPKVPSYEKPNVQMFLPLLRVLGKGSFGKVVLCQKRTGEEKGTLFAMKILRKTHLVMRRQIERTRTERKVLSVVDHPFIMKLHYAFQTEDKLYLVLDYCPGGELFFHLSRFRRFPERVARFYAAELLLAIGHLHKRGIIYRDLKPENVLLDADGHVKLGDFGLAKAGIRHACEGATSMCGTPEYMAPEVLSQQGHGFCVDYWGLGMLTYEMMTGLPPWYTTDRAKLFRRLKSAPLDVPSYFSTQSASVVNQFLHRDPRRRLGANGIRNAMEHEFFHQLNWRALYARRVAAPIHPCEGWNPDASNHNDLDAATANFDNTFTRMKVDTEDNATPNDDVEAAQEELHENTFVGFTFDVENPDAMLKQAAQMNGRQRSHHFQK